MGNVSKPKKTKGYKPKKIKKVKAPRTVVIGSR